MPAWETYLAQHQTQYLNELKDFLTIPSISALPEHAADVQQAGEWVAARLIAAGVEHVKIMPTAGHPIVYGDWLHAAGRPTILIYGHFDVRPADHAGNQAAHVVLKQLYGRAPYYVRIGGSIPVCPLFLKELGAYTVNFAFSLDDEKLHAPDEFFRLSSIERGQRAYCMLLEQLSQYKPTE